MIGGQLMTLAVHRSSYGGKRWTGRPAARPFIEEGGDGLIVITLHSRPTRLAVRPQMESDGYKNILDDSNGNKLHYSSFSFDYIRFKLVFIYY